MEHLPPLGCALRARSSILSHPRHHHARRAGSTSTPTASSAPTRTHPLPAPPPAKAPARSSNSRLLRRPRLPHPVRPALHRTPPPSRSARSTASASTFQRREVEDPPPPRHRVLDDRTRSSPSWTSRATMPLAEAFLTHIDHARPRTPSGRPPKSSAATSRKLEAIQAPFPRLSYDEAHAMLEKAFAEGKLEAPHALRRRLPLPRRDLHLLAVRQAPS